MTTDFAKRPEVTVSTMGKVNNPSGEGVRAVSKTAQTTAAKHSNSINSKSGGGTNGNAFNSTKAAVAPHETKVGKEGTAKRNIHRKKTSDRDSGNYNSAHKKQGGHGKGEWKEVMEGASAMLDDMPAVDEKDPLYDEAEDATKYVLTSSEAISLDNHRGFDPGTERAVYGPLLTMAEFKIQLSTALQEYFDSCDATEVIRTLEELKCQEYHATEIVKKAISLSLDKGPRERELVSRLLTCLHPTPLSLEDMQTGFQTLLDALDELSKDVPEAKTMAASFLARAVVDEVLPPAFLSEQNNDRPGDVVIEKAVGLLNREHCTARLERVWGPGDGRPVEELKKEMDQLLQEYLLSRELDEAARCVKELDAPHFHHELVKRGVKHAMEQDGKAAAEAAKKESPEGGGTKENGKGHSGAENGDKKTNGDTEASAAIFENMDAMAALFGFLVRNAIVSEYQVKKGLVRLHKLLPDFSLDVPAAPTLLVAFENMAAERDCLPTSPTQAAAKEQSEGQEEQKGGETTD